MEPIVFTIVLTIAFFALLYFVIRAAVRDGMLEARRLSQAEPPAEETPAPQDAEPKQ